MKFFTLKIITPEKLVLEESVFQVTLPIIHGEITILADHVPYIGALQNGGEVFLKSEKENRHVVVFGGFVEFHGNILTVLADSAERSEDIDLVAAEEARLRAQKNAEHAENEEYATLLAMIEKETFRTKIAKKHHSHRRI